MLAEILARLATYLENTARLRKKVKSAMMYPTVAMSFSAIIVFARYPGEPSTLPGAKFVITGIQKPSEKERVPGNPPATHWAIVRMKQIA